MTAERIAEWSKALGGDGRIALYYTSGRRPWEAVTTVDRPRARGRYVSAHGSTPDDALRALLRILPPVPTRGGAL